MKVKGNLVDIHKRCIFPAVIAIHNSRISDISKNEEKMNNFILPGLIDSHVHIESSMLTPSFFAEAAVRHGTIGAISDPHEIANVMGLEGIEFMIKDGSKSPLYFWFGAPSCVPATDFETSGAEIGSREVCELLLRNEIKYLSEMMNFPGVINSDRKVIEKMLCARSVGKPIDGHAPGLKGKDLAKYAEAGISTDHECSTMEEAREKIALGMKIQIREGSAARNLDSLKELIREVPDKVMLCSDDIHPETLKERHINKLVSKLIKEGFDLFDVVRSCTVNPAEHYRLESGTLRTGDFADFIVVDGMKEMNVLETWIKGIQVYNRGRILFTPEVAGRINNFNCSYIAAEKIKVEKKGSKMRVMVATDGELLTGSFLKNCTDSEIIGSDTAADILKIVVKGRYNDSPPAIGFINGFGLKNGAIATSVAHDSHNLICVGVSDSDIITCMNRVISMKGGLAVTIAGHTSSLELGTAGIMSSENCTDVARKYEELGRIIRSAGCKLSAPFMTLSFMSLLVIPELKICDRGLFDVNVFRPVSLFVE